MPESWDSVKLLIGGKERMKDIYALEAEYLEAHQDSAYLTDIIGLERFPDYIDYLPKGAIVRKIKVMGYLPQKEAGQYSYIGMSKEEFDTFCDEAVRLVVNALKKG